MKERQEKSPTSSASSVVANLRKKGTQRDILTGIISHGYCKKSRELMNFNIKVIAMEFLQL